MSKLYAGLTVLKDGSFSFEDALLYYTDTPLSYFIIKTILNRKKETEMAEIKNLAALDLRNFSPAALRKIPSIKNVALVMLPENPSPEFTEAYAAIQKTNIASETNVPDNACFFNGQANLTEKDVVKDSMIICNGLAILRDIPKEMNVKIIVNGSLIKSDTAFVEIIKINGAKYEIDNDAKLIVSNPEIRISNSFLENLSEKTAIIACGTIKINDEITSAMLKEKGIVFYNIGTIIAKEELHGYIHANSHSVGTVCSEISKGKTLKKLFKRKKR